MKRYLFILILLLAVNFSTPDNYRLIANARHKIENVQNVNYKKNLDDIELAKMKIKLYSELLMLQYRISVIDRSYMLYNNSS